MTADVKNASGHVGPEGAGLTASVAGLVGRSRPGWRALARVVRLHAASRRVPGAAAVIIGCGVALRIALIGHWDAYGALQLPLVIESLAAATIAITTASPLGEAERVAGRWLPALRLATTLALTALAVLALSLAGYGAHLSGGTLGVLRNVAGVTGLGLLCAVLLGGGLGWTGPTGYLIAGVYGLYTQWHPPAITTPWLWPARPTHDVGAALCAGMVFIAGLAVVTARGARDRVREPG